MKSSVIMIVEDETIIAMELEAKLKLMGYDVCGKARNFDTAIKMAEEKHPDLILMDINLGSGKNGIETAGKIRETMDIPVIFLTAYSDDETIQMAKESGPYGYLTKPLKESELKPSIEMAIEKHRSASHMNIKFHWIAENASDGYIFIDKDDTVHYANIKAKSFLDISEKDMFNVNFLKLIKDKYDLRPEELWKKWPEVEQNIGNLYLVRPETEKTKSFWLEVNVLIPDAVSELRIVSLKNISEEISIHESSRTISSMVSHKLRTPMNHLMNALAFLSKGDLDPEDFKEFSEMAQDSSRRLMKTMQDILNYGGSLNVSLTSYDLNSLSAAVEKISSELEIQNISFSMSEELSDAQIHFSKEAMEIILFEILENALKFNPDHAPSVRVEVINEKNPVIRIHNDGNSIPVEYLGQVWQPFFQGEKYATGEMKGTGLGLPTVASLVWSSGGNCRIYNTSGGGVTVEISIPLLKTSKNM